MNGELSGAQAREWLTNYMISAHDIMFWELPMEVRDILTEKVKQFRHDCYKRDIADSFAAGLKLRGRDA